jgi:hypothetical protein
MPDSLEGNFRPRRARRNQRQPGFHPFFRVKGRRRVQDGYRVFWYESGTRKRTWVRTEKEAQNLVKAKQGLEVLVDAGYHQITTFLDPLQVKAAERSFQLLHDQSYLDLKDANTSEQLVLAVKWFLTHYKKPSAAPTVAELAVAFQKSRAHRDKRTRDDYRFTLRPFIEAFEKQPIDQITAQQISEFLAARPVSTTTRRKLWSILRVFFNLACKKSEYSPRWLTDNPVKEVTRPNAVSPKRIIYQLSEVKDLIQVAIYLGCAPLIVFRLFTMMRADEAKRFLATHAQVHAEAGEGQGSDSLKKGRRRKQGIPRDYREDIRHETSIIDFQEPTNPKYSRKIPILPVLASWLKLFEARGLPLRHTRLEEEARRIAVPQKFGAGFDNLIRHTAISNYVTFSRSLSDTAYVAGTSEDIIRKHYRDYVSVEAAQAFYELIPERFDVTTLYSGRRYTSDAVLAQFVERYPEIDSFIARRAHHREASAIPAISADIRSDES